MEDVCDGGGDKGVTGMARCAGERKREEGEQEKGRKEPHLLPRGR